MTDSMDALYCDWRRWRDRSESRARVDSAAVGNADQWWTQHLAQFRRLIDPLHVAARAERERKDRSTVRARPHPARSRRYPCQGRTESTSVAAGKIHQFEGWREWWFGFWQGEREGELPSLLHGMLNEAGQRTEESYPGSVVG